MNELVVYPNASKGGITSVIRGRAVEAPSTRFDVIFFDDRGGAQAFADLPNVRVSIIQRGRAEPAIKYLTRNHSYSTVSVLSSPEIVKHLETTDSHVRYEFHSSDMKINKNEIRNLDLRIIDEISTPTDFMASAIRPLLPREHRKKLAVVPNLVDKTIFTPDGSTEFYAYEALSSEKGIPLIWVGRFDEGKGYRHFIRTLAALPSEYRGILVVSLEKDPNRASAFFNECAAMGVLERIELYLNQSQFDMAKLYRWAAERDGRAVSTSLLESFGYFVAEAASCGLPVVAFDLPVWKEHEYEDRITTVPIGSVTSLVHAICN